MGRTIARWLGKRGEAPSPREDRTPSETRLDDSIVAAVDAHLDGRDEALIAVVGRDRAALIDALHAARPGWTVIEPAADDSTRHVQLALQPPLDAIIDSPRAGRRLHRFRTTFYFLRPGGLYLVPNGASELDDGAGPLGEVLAAAAALEPTELGRDRRRSATDTIALALRHHVTAWAIGPHLALTHDVSGVLAKLDEVDGAAWIRSSGAGHRIIREHAPEAAPDAAVLTEGPVPRQPPMDRPIKPAPLFLREYRDMVVDVEQRVLADRVLLPETYRRNQVYVLRNRGVIDLAARHGVLARPLPADLPRLDGTYVYLDDEVRGHFGHTMTEVLSRMWTWPAALEIAPDAQVLMSATQRRPEIAEWEYRFYEACGIPRERIVKIDGPVRVERLISGSPMLSNPQFVDPRIVETWDRVGDALAAQASGRTWPPRIFVGRRIAKRACVNGADVEAIFRGYGFEVVFPEEHPLGDQVAMFRAAEVVAGYAGSGLFHIAFVHDPVHVIEVGSDAYIARNEVLMAAVRGHRLDYVVSRAKDTSFQSAFTFDLEREGPYLRSILDQLPGID